MTEEFTFDKWRIRAEMVEALELYTTQGRPLGGFLEAVVSNDFMSAVGRADSDNLANLPAFAAYVYNEMPSNSHGSPRRYEEWISK